MLLYLSITGILLSLILLFNNFREFKSRIYLASYFIIISVYCLNAYVFLYSKSVFWVAVFGPHFTFLYYLIGPLFYLYIRSVITDDPRFRRRDLIHLAPMIVYLIAVVPYFITPFSYKTEIAAKIVNNPDILAELNFTILSEWFSVLYVYISRVLLILIYLICSFIMFWRFVKRHEDFRILTDKFILNRWLLIFFGFTFILILSNIFLLFISYNSDSMVPFYTMNLLNILTGLGLSGLILSLFFFPVILYGMPQEPVYVDKVVFQERKLRPEADKALYEPNFKIGYLLEIQEKVLNGMTESQLFLQPHLTLNKFADILQIPPHHLIYYFREYKNQSFNDFNNECKVKYAMNLMVDSKTTRLTIEAIGLLSGFNNRVTFFRAFKKAQGISTSEYLAQISRNSSII